MSTERKGRRAAALSAMEMVKRGESNAIDDLWTLYDNDGNGVVEKKERQKFFRHLYHFEYSGQDAPPEKKEVVAKWMKQYDTDGDKAFNKKEFSSMIKDLIPAKARKVKTAKKGKSTAQPKRGRKPNYISAEDAGCPCATGGCCDRSHC